MHLFYGMTGVIQGVNIVFFFKNTMCIDVVLVQNLIEDLKKILQKETEHFLVYMAGFLLTEQIIMHICTDGIVITGGEHDIPVDKIRRGIGNLGNTGFLIKNTAVVCCIFAALL